MIHFTGIHHDIRPLLDYTYHKKYSEARVAVQDRLIEELCRRGTQLDSGMLPWVVFTAGAMGAGKGYVQEFMHKQGYWNLDYFIKVDPDQIREMLPEWAGYVERDHTTAGAMTQKEAGCIAEILSYKGLRDRRSVIIDGSLRDANWYKDYFSKLRRAFPGIRIMILHITTKLETILANAEERAARTGRGVPREMLIDSFNAVPASVDALAPFADFACRVENEMDSKPRVVRQEGAPFPPESVEVSWDLVKRLWKDVDTDGDGVLTREEVSEALRAGVVTETAIKSMDVDGDNIIEEREVKWAKTFAHASGTMVFK